MIIAYEIAIITMLFIEYRHFNSYLTPFSIMGCCYAAAPIIINTIGVNIGMYAMEDYNFLYTMVYLVIIWTPGFFVRCFTEKSKLFNHNRIERNIKRVEKFEIPFFLVFLFCVFMFLTTVIGVLLTYGFSGAKNHTMGIGAHFGYLALMLAPYIAYHAINRKRILYYMLIISFVLELIVLQNKLPIVVLLLQSVYYVFIMKGRVKGIKIIKTGVVVILAVMLLFVGIYSLQPWIIDRTVTMEEATSYGFKRFVHYFFSGFISSNEYYLHPAGNTYADGMRVAFGFIDTLKEAIFGSGDYVSPVIQKWVFIAPERGTNVGGIFSELVYQIGFLNAGIYVFCVGVIVYFFYNLSSKYQIFVNTTAYLMAMTSVSFFCNFFSLFSTFEKLIYVIILDFIIWKVHAKGMKVILGEKALN